MSTLGTFSFGTQKASTPYPLELGAPLSSPTGPTAGLPDTSIPYVHDDRVITSGVSRRSSQKRWSWKNAESEKESSFTLNNDEPIQSPEETLKAREEAVGDLARKLTRQSTRPEENLFNYEPGSDLDPFSDHFNARKYVKGMASLTENAGPTRLSGVSFSNLSVHGYGSDAGERLLG